MEISGGSPKSGQTTGRSLLITERHLSLLGGGDVIPASFCRLIRIDESKATSTYVAYYLRWLYVTGQAGRFENQSTGISNFQFKYFCEEGIIPLPSLVEQRRIAAVMKALDRKVAANERLAQRLSQIPQLWFRRLFGSGAGEVPLVEVAHIVRGRSYKSSELLGDETALVTLKSFRREGGYQAAGLKPYCGPYKTEQVVEPGEVLVAHTDLTQDGDVIGRPVLIPDRGGYQRLVASLDTCIVRPGSGRLTNRWVYHLLACDSFKLRARAFANGSTVLHLGKDALADYRIEVPTRERLGEFERVAAPIHQQIVALRDEQRRLEAIGESLLPKLISGQLRVAEIQVQPLPGSDEPVATAV